MFQGKSDSWVLSLAAHLMKMTAADGVDLSVIHTQCRTHEKYKYCFFKAVSNLTLSNITETGASSKQTKQTDPLGFLKLGKEHFKAHFLTEEFLGFLWSPAGACREHSRQGWQWEVLGMVDPRLSCPKTSQGHLHHRSWRLDQADLKAKARGPLRWQTVFRKCCLIKSYGLRGREEAALMDTNHCTAHYSKHQNTEQHLLRFPHSHSLQSQLSTWIPALK